MKRKIFLFLLFSFVMTKSTQAMKNASESSSRAPSSKTISSDEAMRSIRTAAKELSTLKNPKQILQYESTIVSQIPHAATTPENFQEIITLLHSFRNIQKRNEAETFLVEAATNSYTLALILYKNKDSFNNSAVLDNIYIDMKHRSNFFGIDGIEEESKEHDKDTVFAAHQFTKKQIQKQSEQTHHENFYKKRTFCFLQECLEKSKDKEEIEEIEKEMIKLIESLSSITFEYFEIFASALNSFQTQKNRIEAEKLLTAEIPELMKSQIGREKLETVAKMSHIKGTAFGQHLDFLLGNTMKMKHAEEKRTKNSEPVHESMELFRSTATMLAKSQSAEDSQELQDTLLILIDYIPYKEKYLHEIASRLDIFRTIENREEAEKKLLENYKKTDFKLKLKDVVHFFKTSSVIKQINEILFGPAPQPEQALEDFRNAVDSLQEEQECEETEEIECKILEQIPYAAKNPENLKEIALSIYAIKTPENRENAELLLLKTAKATFALKKALIESKECFQSPKVLAEIDQMESDIDATHLKITSKKKDF